MAENLGRPGAEIAAFRSKADALKAAIDKHFWNPTTGRYDYQLRFELTGPGTALEAVEITHDIQHSQRPLPALGKGDNTITEGTAKLHLHHVYEKLKVSGRMALVQYLQNRGLA